MSAVSVSGLSKSFGQLRVLKDIDLPIEAGDFTVLLGPSGCGKSTLLNAIAGLEDTDTGIIEIDGTDVTHDEPSKRGIAMVFQSVRPVSDDVGAQEPVVRFACQVRTARGGSAPGRLGGQAATNR